MDGSLESTWSEILHARSLQAIILAITAVIALDALLFRTGLYTSILQPDSSTGTFELVLRREQQAQALHGRDLIVTLGNSRFAYYPRVANEQTPTTGFTFRSRQVRHFHGKGRMVICTSTPGSWLRERLAS